MADVQIQVLAKAKVLGCPIDAGYVKLEKPDPEAPDDNTKKIIESWMIVYGKVESTPDELSLTDLVTECQKMVAFFASGDEAKKRITEALPPMAENVLDAIKFRLKEVFFIKPLSGSRTTDDKGNPQITRNDSKGLTSEFAFWFDIDIDELTKGWPIAVQNVSLKLWKTTNPRILQEMNISSMQELLDFSKGIDREPAQSST